MKKSFIYQRLLFQIVKISILHLALVLVFTSITVASPAKGQEMLDSKVSLTLNNVSLEKALSALEKTAQVKFSYNSRALNLSQKVSVNANNDALSNVLNKLLKPLSIKYIQVSNRIVLREDDEQNVGFSEEGDQTTKIDKIASDDITIKGTVTDENGEKLPGVSISVKGTTRGTTTNSKGEYSIVVPDDKAILVFSFVGYMAQEIVSGSRTNQNVVLKVENKALDEVVVVGYGSQMRKDVTGSIASINTKDIKDMPVTNIAEGMAGKVPGVLIQQTTGAPGNSPSIKIRGLGSISAGNGPLIVVDGQALNSGDLRNGSGLNLLNPNDIESVDVLKDAAATAIFGSRGANGVMMISTKRGKSGKNKISFDYYTGTQEVSKKLDVLNAQQFAVFSKEASNNAYLERVAGSKITDPNSIRPAGNRYRYPRGEFTGIDFDNPTSLNSYNYQDLIFRSAPISNYQLAASGGTDKIQFMISGNYLEQEGVILNSGINRFTFRSNIDATLSSKLKVGVSISPSYTTDRIVNSDGHWANNGIINAALSQVPIIPIFQPDGIKYNSQASISGAYDWPGITNPVANITELDNTANTMRIIGNTYAEFAIWKKLKYRGTIGGDLTFFRQNQFQTSAIPLNQLLPPNVSTGSSATNQNINWITTHTLSNQFELNKDQSLDVLIGFEAQQNTFQSNSINANRFPNDIVRTVNAGTVLGGSSFQEQWALASYFTRIGYSFKGKYLFNATLRQDGSSRFGANQRYGIFPSASVGWRLSEESFMKNMSFISDMKLKVSYGLAGNNAFSNYGSIGILVPDNFVFGNNLVNGLAPSTIGNENLTWEKSRQTDIGLETGLFRNRLFLTIDYYSRTTTDLLLSVQVPTLSGFASANRNIGKVENEGMEFGLSTRNMVKEFKWSTDFNISFNRNKVLALGLTGDAIRSGSGVGETNITVIGNPLGNFYGYQQIGIYKDQADLDASPKDPTSRLGDVKFADINNDGKINADDRTLIGNNQPDFVYGLTNTISFKGIDLGITMQGVQGGEILNLSRRFIENLEGNANQLSTVLNRWKSPQEPGDGIVPRANQRTTGNNNAISSRWVEDASYFRVRNITLGYSLSKRVIERLSLQSLRIYGGIQNAFTSAKYLGYNPEVSGYENALTGGVDYGSYPLTRTYTVGLNIGF